MQKRGIFFEERRALNARSRTPSRQWHFSGCCASNSELLAEWIAVEIRRLHQQSGGQFVLISGPVRATGKRKISIYLKG